MLIDSRYEVIEKLGESVWSIVYKVKDLRTDKVYALKLYQNLDSETLYEKFSAEDMFIITKTEHPNLLKVYSFGNYDKHIYSLSEFYDGSTLSEFKFSNGTLDDLYRIIVQVCYGLHELHRRGIVHKDLKPENIMYRIEAGQIKVKILDFGFAKIDLEKSQQHISGTLPYIAPEIFRGKPATPESDFYSLGVTLYKIVTGSLPYTLEQLSDIITGTKTSVFPKFPTEFNAEISSQLEKLILKMMEKTGDERFHDSFSIISYINRIQSATFTFSWKYSLINSIKHSSYLVRDDYTHQLLGYLPLIEKKSGKVIVMTGEEGSGKNSILTLFRYHLLSNRYYVFDFTCTAADKDPFYALIREFVSSVKDNREITAGLKNVSPELRRYIEEQEVQNQESNKPNNLDKHHKQPETTSHDSIEDLQMDYTFAESFLEHLSEDKPLIFIIRVGHHLSNESIGFINYVSNTIKNNRIMIILSLDNLGLTSCDRVPLEKGNTDIQDAAGRDRWKDTCIVGGLIHTVHIPIMPLSLKKTKEYIEYLLGVTPPDSYCRKFLNRSNGNPSYIRQLLVDLIEKKMLLKPDEKKNSVEDTLAKKSLKKVAAHGLPLQSGTFNFSLQWDNYKLPDAILHNIYNKLSHLTENSYKALRYLAIAFTPLSSSLIRHLLNINDKELFFLIRDCINNHILTRHEDYYYFSYSEAKERLFNESNTKTKLKISRKLLEYFEDKNITKPEICEGLIINSRLAEDNNSLRRYSLLLAQLHTNAGDREQSFELICDVIALDFSKDIDVSKREVLKDLALFQETAELTGKINAALELFNSISSMPDIFEKYYIRGILNNASENYSEGLKNLEKALNKTITGKQRINALINIVWSNINLKDNEKARAYLDILDGLEMTTDVKVSYIDRKAVYLYNQGRTKEALKIMEDFKDELHPVESATYYARIGSFYNNLALFHASLRSFDEAQKYFSLAKNIWEQISYKRSLGMSYNNLGDLALRQGRTAEALEYFSKALEICKPIRNLKCQVLTYLNFGEAYIKLGKYREAENFLLQAKSVMAETKDKSFLNSIIHNMAIAKNKIKDLNNYYRFIKENSPLILSETIETINPLVKTYFQFLLDIGDPDNLSRLLTKNTKLDYLTNNEDEFYHQVTGLMLKAQGKYEEALSHLHTALTYAERNRSSYAQSIINCKLAECYIELNLVAKAQEAKDIAEKLSRKFKYSYWLLETKLLKIRLQLLDPEINLRIILRNLLNLLEQAKQQQLYMLELDAYHYLSLIYRELKSKKRENHYRSLYFLTVKKTVQGLPKALQKLFTEKKTAEFEKSLRIESAHKRVTARTSKDNAISQKNEIVTDGLIIAKRTSQAFEPWQEHLYELLKLDETERMQFFIKKMLIKMFAPNFFSLYLTEDKSKEVKPFINYHFHQSIQDSKEHKKSYNESLRKNETLTVVLDNCNTLYIPLRFKSIIVGCLIIGDEGELPFTRKELSLAKELRLHMTALLVRIRDITAIEKNTDQMKQLMTSGNEIFSLKDVERIEQEMVSFCIDFTRCSRAFLIKKDAFGNFVYEMAMDSNKNILNDYSHISKTVLSEVYNREQFIYTLNAMVDSTLKNSISVQDYRLHSIYCAPIMIEKEVHALLYIDNLKDKVIDLQLNLDLMDIFLLQMSIAIKNAKQYSSLMKKNRELHYLDTAKTEFMAIISHELNTPLVTLQNYVGQLKDEKLKTEAEREIIFNSVENSLAKIMDKVNDIFSFTKYSLLSKISKAKIDIKSLLEIIISEAEILSKSRNMIFRLEVKEDLPPIEANWESFYLMIYQIVLNSIRFTKDFGSIHLGARKSSFQDEEIDKKESLVIYIQDNGMGIPAKDLETIFIPFKELNDLYSHQSGTIEFRSSGLGLGLSTAKRIAELHSGRINVKSKEGEGTTVFIILPFSGKE